MAGDVDPQVAVVNIAVDRLRQLLSAAFGSTGMSLEEAALITESLVDAELCEVPTHGVYRVPAYLRGLKSGRLNTNASVRVIYESGVAALVDGDNALGYRPTVIAVAEATARASRHGVGFAGVRSTNEFGRAAFYAKRVAEAGFIGIVCQNTLPLLGAPGSTRPTHGNNPFAFATPGPNAAVFDAAWTPRSGGEIGRRRMLGLPIPKEWGYVDASGAITTDPAALAATLPAVGGGKGFGMAVLVDLLAAGLTGAAANVEVPKNNSQVGAFVAALSPDLFGEGTHFLAALSAGATAVRDASARWPGDRSEGARARNLVAGQVAIATKIFDAAVEAAAEIDSTVAAALQAAVR